MAPVYIGLIHYPIYNKHMEVVTTADRKSTRLNSSHL